MKATILCIFLHFSLLSCSDADSIDYLNNFKDLAELPYFVDKTDILPALLSTEKNRTYHILTAPRKFGKSSIIDMIRRFVEIPINKTSGELINKTRTTIYRLFSKTLKISKNTEFVEQHCCEYPVILVNFSDIKGGSLRQQEKYFRSALQRTARRYGWLYKLHLEQQNNTKDIVKTMQFRAIGRLILGESNEADMRDSLHDLSKAIFEHFGKPPVLLVDSFDTPILQSIRKSISDAQNVTTFVNELLFMGLKFPPYISRFAILTGTSGSFADIAASLSPIKRWKFLENNVFASCFGLTSDEIQRLQDQYNFSAIEREKLDSYYNGYYVHDKESSDNSSIKIYNIFSVMKFIREREKTSKSNFSNYWQSTDTASELNYFMELPIVRGRLCHMLLRKIIVMNIPDTITEPDLKLLQTCKSDVVINYQEGALYFIYLLENGYITRDRSSSSDTNQYRIANKDAEFEIVNSLQLFYKSINIDIEQVAELLGVLLDQVNHTADTLQQIKINLKKQADKLPDADRFSFQAMLLSAARLRYPLSESNIVRVDEKTQQANEEGTSFRIELIIRNDNGNTMSLHCVKNRELFDVILKDEKNRRGKSEDSGHVSKPRNRAVAIYHKVDNSIDFDIVDIE